MTARERLIAAPGTCAHCRQHADERVTVSMVDTGSGPGWANHACLPCARRLAQYSSAPQWLRDDLAIVDAEQPALRVAE